MKNVNKKFLALITIIFFYFLNNTYAVEFRGVGSETYSGVKTTKKINTTLETAKKNACKNAFDKYVQGMEESKRMIFESIQGPIYQNLNEYMTCETMIEENIDKKKKKVTVVMKANIDETRLNIEIKKNSKVFDTKSDDKSKLAMIFFSRTIDAQRSYDERVSKKKKTSSGVDINEEETDTGVTSSTTETSSTETGGSTLKKADVSMYKVDDNDTVKIEAAMKEIFTKARFEPRSGKRLVRKNWRKLRGEIVESLENGGSIPDEARWDIEDILIDKGIKYVVFAYFDVGVPEANPNGGRLVVVALNYAEIMNLGGSEPVSLGTISDIQERGEGSNNDIAKNNAIANTSKEAGKRIVALINSKGLN